MPDDRAARSASNRIGHAEPKLRPRPVTASPWHGTGRGPERNRALSGWVFASSLIVHTSVAIALRVAAADHAERPAPSKIEVELAPPPPPPPPPPPEEPEPPPQPQAAKPVRQTAPRPAQVKQPSRVIEAASPAASDLPVSDEGTEPPAPPAPVAAPPPPPPPPPPSPAPIVQAAEGANYAKNPRPAYPHLAAREGWEGKVLLRVKVLPSGKVGEVTLHKSAGRSVLDEAALAIVKTWTFVPASQAGKPIPGWVVVPIDFQLK